MIKSLSLLAFAGTIGASGLADHLKSSTAIPPGAVPLVLEERHHGQEGADDGSLGLPGYDPWAGNETSLFTVGFRFGKEGGEGGEGGEGARIHHIAPPVLATLPGVSVPCGSRNVIGTLLGAASGGLLGSKVGDGRGQLAAVAAGTVFGAFLGHEIGASLGTADVACFRAAEQRAHATPIGTPIVWKNPETGHTGTITPVREGSDRATGQYCREYQQTVTVGGKTERAYGTACRQPDGSWQIKS